MKKQTMIVSLAALALLVSPLGNMGGLARVSAEEQRGAELYSVSGNEQETGVVPLPQRYNSMTITGVVSIGRTPMTTLFTLIWIWFLKRMGQKCGQAV